MGKNQHSKDKLYIVAKEFARDWGGYKKKGLSLPFRALPFDCCALSLLPFTNPVCTDDGIVFDAESILAYISQYHRHPVTGAPLSKRSLIPLRFHKNSSGAYHCPILYKEFTPHSHIVANRLSGHVYSYEAIDSLCRRPKHWLDLITNEPFTAGDIITIQDPKNIEGRKIEEFDYIKNAKDASTAPLVGGASGGSTEAYTNQSKLMSKILSESGVTENEIKEKHRIITGGGNEGGQGTGMKKKHSIYSNNQHAASFTSTTAPVHYEAEYRDMTDKEIRTQLYAEVKKRKKKGYVRLITSLGLLNFELHSDIAPQACHNFIKHCKSGYYDGTIFHRLIPNFMVQGGDPTGTGKGGESAFENGLPFEDEYHPHFTHTNRGVLSMANSGVNTNRSQFFITFKSCEHLNNKHTVFGKLVGGVDTLSKLEVLPTRESDNRPKHPPHIREVNVFVDPFEETEEEIRKEVEAEAKKKEKKEREINQCERDVLDPMKMHPKRQSNEIGKYTNVKHVVALHNQSSNIDGDNSSMSQNSSTSLPKVPTSKAARETNMKRPISSPNGNSDNLGGNIKAGVTTHNISTDNLSGESEVPPSAKKAKVISSLIASQLLRTQKGKPFSAWS